MSVPSSCSLVHILKYAKISASQSSDFTQHRGKPLCIAVRVKVRPKKLKEIKRLWGNISSNLKTRLTIPIQLCAVQTRVVLSELFISQMVM